MPIICGDPGVPGCRNYQWQGESSNEEKRLNEQHHVGVERTAPLRQSCVRLMLRISRRPEPQPSQMSIEEGFLYLPAYASSLLL